MEHKTSIDMNSTTLTRSVRSEISFPTKLFCFSLAVEPLMFFVLTDPHQTGSSFTLSRLLQILVGIYFVAFVVKKGLIIPNPSYRFYILYFRFVVVGLFSSVLGAAFYGSYFLNSSGANTDVSTVAAQILRGPYSRPFIEVIISVYYFVYFVVVPRYVLKTTAELKYIIDLIVNIFKFSLAFGILDVVQYLVTGINFIPRHLIDSAYIELGTRYHGIAGEPRDAFPYLVFGLAMCFLRSALFQQASPSKAVIFLTAFALLLTQSASGIIGVGFALCIYILTDLKINFVRLAKMAGILIVTISIAVIAVLNTDRLLDYIVAAEGLYDVLMAKDELHPMMLAQSSNIFPLWQILLYLKDFNLIPVIFGSGFGSASFINNNLGGTMELINPQSNAVRLFFEVGILGFWLYLTSQLLLIRRLKTILRSTCTQKFYYLAILLTGICLGHRSTTIFILCGIALAIISNQHAFIKSPSFSK
jgi:hypothetical protein